MAEVWIVRVWLVTKLEAVTSERKDGPKQEVLYDWELAEYFCQVHLDHSGVDFVPCFYSGDVVEHR